MLFAFINPSVSARESLTNIFEFTGPYSIMKPRASALRDGSSCVPFQSRASGSRSSPTMGGLQ